MDSRKPIFFFKLILSSGDSGASSGASQLSYESAGRLCGMGAARFVLQSGVLGI